MPTIDYSEARRLLEQEFAIAEAALGRGEPPAVDQPVIDACDIMFRSTTQAYREVLLGCAIAKMLDNSTDIRLPYVQHGPNAFNGRTLDERVVNPFLQDKRIPSSRGPYLGVFRRSVRFDGNTREGLRACLGSTEMCHAKAQRRKESMSMA